MRNWGAVAALAFAGAALGQTADENFCQGTAGTPDDRIAACTRAITSGQLSRDSLGRVFFARGY